MLLIPHLVHHTRQTLTKNKQLASKEEENILPNPNQYFRFLNSNIFHNTKFNAQLARRQSLISEDSSLESLKKTLKVPFPRTVVNIPRTRSSNKYCNSTDNVTPITWE